MRFILLIVALSGSTIIFSQSFYLLIGTYTSGKSEGIYVYNFNVQTGDGKPIYTAKKVTNPSFLTIAPSNRYVYAVNETGGQQPGEVSAFSFNKSNGQLLFINKQATGGDDPCYISVDKSGKWIVVANYSGGNLSIFPINSDGSLQPYKQLIQHNGKGVNEQRQESPHVHSTVFSPDYHFVIVADLGLDKVISYRFNRLIKAKPLSHIQTILTNPGSGPRHIDFHPNGKYMYLMEELSGEVALYKYTNGKLSFIQRINSYPSDYKDEKGSADIHVSPDGHFVYASNRGNANNIAIFSVNSGTGKLTIKGFQPVLGIKPRNFVIDPTGNYLLVANQETSNIVIFKRNKKTGLLTDTGNRIEVPNPVCLKFINP